jgi:CheY-like chemotaxis protein
MHTLRKAVIADDDLISRNIEKKIVESIGLATLCCVNGRTAWELLDANPDIALLVLDIEMPELDGFALLRRIRGDERFDDLEILVVSGRCSLEDASLLLAGGADAFQPKPVKPATLVENISLLMLKGA